MSESVVSKAIAARALFVFREEQKKRTVGQYSGCQCDACVECMKAAIKVAIKEIRRCQVGIPKVKKSPRKSSP